MSRVILREQALPGADLTATWHGPYDLLMVEDRASFLDVLEALVGNPDRRIEVYNTERRFSIRRVPSRFWNALVVDALRGDPSALALIDLIGAIQEAVEREVCVLCQRPVEEYESSLGLCHDCDQARRYEEASE